MLAKHASPSLLFAALLILALSVTPLASAQEGNTPVVWPTDGWTTSTPEAQGMDSAAVAAYLLALSEPSLTVDSVMLVRHGQVVAEAYYAPSTADTRFSVYSATKSVTSALVGIALEQGFIKSIDEPVLSFFPDRTVSNLDAQKQAMTLRDLLTMGSGFACNVNAGQDPEKDVWAADDWLQATLELPMAGAPGEQWRYCNLNFALVAAILEAATGQSAMEFAQANLFGPLGITEVVWATRPDGGNGGAAGLQFSLRDWAKFGYLYLHGGQWDGAQIVPAQWVADSLTNQLSTPFGVGYGYGWWVFEGLGVLALGGGGQYIFVLPGLDVLLVATGTATEATRTMHQLPALLGGLMSMPYAGEPLPENPEGEAQLAAAIAAVANPAPAAVPPLPEMAGQIDGKVYGLFSPALVSLEPVVDSVIPGMDTSVLGTQALSLSFSGDAAVLTLFFTDGQQEAIPVGLDGIYRVSTGRLGPIGAKGEWLTPNTFRVYLKNIGGSLQYRLDMTFNGAVLEIIAFEVHRGDVKAVFGATG